MEILTTPAEIERESMKIIDRELSARGIALPPGRAAVVKRVIHATADFDFAQTLRFTPDAPQALRGGVIVTDTNMALAGINRDALRRLGMSALCFMAEKEIADAAKRDNVTRAAASMSYALERCPGAVFAVGNAPTAALRLADGIEAGARPALVIGAPVGFVNAEESKARLWETCVRRGVPAIVAAGRKGGSGVAAAICNALLRSAADMSDPARRNP